MARQDITCARLRELLSYDHETGLFTWLVNKRGRKLAGYLAGSQSVWGYTVIRVDGWICMAHRLAWLYMQGEWPKGEIDHMNGCRTDNRIANLRDVSRTTNAENLIRARVDSTSGVQGVSRSSDGKWWRARIRCGKNNMSIGTYRSVEAAHAAYIEAKRRLHAGCTL